MNTEFGNNLKEVRKFLGVTQVDLANKSGLLPCAISHFEGGRREPNLRNLIKLSKALGVTVDRLLFGVKQKES